MTVAREREDEVIVAVISLLSFDLLLKRRTRRES